MLRRRDGVKSTADERFRAKRARDYATDVKKRRSQPPVSKREILDLAGHFVCVAGMGDEFQIANRLPNGYFELMCLDQTRK